jgi:hypothetical protein
VGGIEEEFEQRTLRIFAVGTALEAVVVEWLREDGWAVYHNAGSQEAEWEIEIPVHGGVIKGHPDVIITDQEGRKYLGDIKTMNGRAFKFWKSQGTMQNKPQYFDQVNVYAHGAMQEGPILDGVAIIAMNKDNSEYHIETLPVNAGLYAETLAKAEYILGKEDPPFPGELPSWACNYCGYRRMGVCPGYDKLEVGA